VGDQPLTGLIVRADRVRLIPPVIDPEVGPQRQSKDQRQGGRLEIMRWWDEWD
jgi:hypothetical protein